MEQAAWVSGAMYDTELHKWMNVDIRETNVDAMMQGLKLLQEGRPVPADCCPKRIWRAKGSSAIKKLPHLFTADGYYIVSQKAADIFRKYDLGDGALYHVTEGIYQKDNQTRVPGEFFTWIFGNTKNAFSPEHTSRKRPFGVAGTRWILPTMPQDEDIAITSAADGKPDVWMDRFLFNSIFVSKQLGSELAKAGMANAFRLYRCRLV